MEIEIIDNIDKRRFDNFSGFRVKTERWEREVLLAVPHNGSLAPEAIFGISEPGASAIPAVKRSSVLTLGFNALWCDALNLREDRGITHFAMHHADLSAPACWLARLIDEMDRVNADVISAAILIKDHRHLVSTGVREHGRIRRFSLPELRQLPKTFCLADVGSTDPDACLMVNTGLWACRFTEQWPEDVVFTNTDGKRLRDDGKWEAYCVTEDWNFSIWAHQRGLRVFATSIMPVKHYGVHCWDTAGPVGTWTTDLGDDALSM